MTRLDTEEAVQTARLLVSTLRQIHKTANAVESLVLLPLIKEAAELENRLSSLADAVGAEGKTV